MQKRLEMEVIKYNLFAIPVTCYNSFLPLELANNIKDYILTEKVTKSKKHNSITGDGYSSHDVDRFDILQEVTRNVPGCSNLLINIEECIKEYTLYNNCPKCILDNSWFNIQNSGSFLLRHSHIGRGEIMISGALYLNVDIDSSSITFENPNPYSIMAPFPGNYSTFNLKPNIGDLILFPAYLIHMSIEPNMTENRMVISFNAK
jgi:uncharacterized protein (TIGR02466 family)